MKTPALLILFAVSVAAISANGQTTKGTARPNDLVMSHSYDDGFRDGYKVGWADAKDGRKRRGLWAREIGERLSEPGSSYSKGYHMGYNEGYAAHDRAYK